MHLNTLKPAPGSKRKAKRVGRGIGSTLGKTCGRGHKGQKSRSGGFHKVGFEGGQMPLQRRLPKVGFTSRKKKYSAEVRLSELNSLGLEMVDISVLKKQNIVPSTAINIKIIKSGKIEKPLTIKGIKVTGGAEASILAAGGKVEA